MKNALKSTALFLLFSISTSTSFACYVETKLENGKTIGCPGKRSCSAKAGQWVKCDGVKYFK
ncbi:MAG: hypothetical protein HC913_09955 [Microscillaceae bacterium]|nr:hypothetical protein [Microscillaceae bacterium]